MRSKVNITRKNYRLRCKLEGRIRPYVSDRLSGWKKKDSNSNLTIDYLENLYNRQKGKCYYTGQKLEFPIGGPKPNGLSLDRKNPKLGYKKGNVVWCTYFVNTMKGGLTTKQFYDLIRAILEKHD